MKPKLANLDLGYLTERIVISELLKRNFKIYEPLMEGGVVDFICYKNKIFKKLQIKTAYFDKKLDRYRLTLLRTRHQKYNMKDFDFFVSYLYEHKVFYIVPTNKVGNQNCINLYPHREKLGKNIYEKYKNNFGLLEN